MYTFKGHQFSILQICIDSRDKFSILQICTHSRDKFSTLQMCTLSKGINLAQSLHWHWDKLVVCGSAQFALWSVVELLQVNTIDIEVRSTHCNSMNLNLISVAIWEGSEYEREWIYTMFDARGDTCQKEITQNPWNKI